MSKEAIEFTPPSFSVFYSVYSRLEFLQLINPHLDGLSEMIEVIKERMDFFSQSNHEHQVKKED
ncbi:MAG: hypothetical protein CUN55_05465 [Phototrophicales bacterium]|nr:MAG: hypothetical protein CUN55_05465 [Phototrophicales bacterium]